MFTAYTVYTVHRAATYIFRMSCHLVLFQQDAIHQAANIIGGEGEGDFWTREVGLDGGRVQEGLLLLHTLLINCFNYSLTASK